MTQRETEWLLAVASYLQRGEVEVKAKLEIYVIDK